MPSLNEGPSTRVRANSMAMIAGKEVVCYDPMLQYSRALQALEDEVLHPDNYSNPKNM